MEIRQPASPVAAKPAAVSLFEVAEKAGSEFLRIWGREHSQLETARADASLLEADRRFEDWKRAYMQNSRGALALNAAADYAEAW